MKTIKTLFLMAGLSAGLSILIAQQPPGPAGAPAAAAPAAAAAADEEVPETVAPQPKDESAVDPIMQRLLDKAKLDRSGALTTPGLERVAPASKPDTEPAGAATGTTVEPVESAPAVGSTTPVPSGSFAGTEGLRMNFVNAPLDTVLNWMSSAAGFIVVKEVRSTARVNVVSLQPMTKDEVVDLLNSVLYKVGIAIIRNNRTLTIVSLDEAKTRGIPVSLWDGDPDSIPKADVTVTMVLPVRFVTVAELLQNVLPLVAPTTPLTANQSGNSIIITDTQANIRRVAEVIKAVDSGAEDVTVVKVFTLKFANPQDIADEISNLFADNTQGGAAAAPMAFGGMAGGGRGGRGGGAAAAGTGTRMRARNRVVAVPDMRTGSVVITASRDVIDNISDTVNALDEGAGAGRNDTLRVFQVDNAEPSEVYQTLTDIFNKNGTTRNNNNTQLNNSALSQRQNNGANTLGTSRTSSLGSSSGFGGGGGGTGGGGMGGGGMGGGGGGR